MNLTIGILMILLGLIISILSYVNIKIKKRISLIWGGFNLLSLSLILITIGIYMLFNRI
jgi:hypothetical protein